MGLFSRKRTDEAADAAADVEVETTDAPESKDRTHGPWDETDRPDRGELLDCGALWIPAVPGASIQFTMDRNRSMVLGVVYLVNGSALQIQVFAAPRSRGLWDDIRLEMMTSIANQGGSSKEADGPLGLELAAMLPGQDGKGQAPYRFMGVDGPRWLLRATVYGRAGADPEKADELLKILDDVVVVRGQTPHPPRELLTLEIPSTIEATQA